MRVHCGPSITERQKAQLIQAKLEANRLQRWTPWFAWYPVRIGEDDCRFMETIERRYKLAEAYQLHSGSVSICKYSVEYRAVAWPEDGM